MTSGFSFNTLFRRSVLGLHLTALLAAVPQTARAGGLYLTPLGAKPSARAGAQVAGGNTLHALWYNPAGIAHAGEALLVDLNLTFARGTFTRFIDDGTTAPTVRARSGVLPVPTLAYSNDFGLSDFNFAVGLLVPPAAALSWPTQVDGAPAPQRFSILDTADSVIASLAFGAAYRPRRLDRLALGVALYVTFARLGGEVAVSACDYAVCTQPEAPEWEGRTRFLLGPVATATANFGARYDFDRVRIGGSLLLRTKIAGEAEFDVLLPDQFLFDDVVLENTRGGRDLKADMSITLPMIARLGVETDLTRSLAVELAAAWENWSDQGDITVHPRGVLIRNVPAFGDVRAQPITVSRNTRDTWSLALGGTQDLRMLTRNRRGLSLSAGAMLESSSLARQDMSPTALDTGKLLLGIGGSVEIASGVTLDVSYGHLFMRNQTVRDSQVRLPAAIRPTPVDPTPDTYEPGEPPRIGNGRYTIEADYVALGLRWQIDAPKQHAHSQ